MMRPRLAVAILGSAALCLVSGPAHGETDWRGEAEDDAVILTAREAAASEREWTSSGTDPALRLTEYQRADLCGATSAGPTTALNGDCATYTGAVQIPVCEVPPPIQPLWRRDRATLTDPWSDWRYVSAWSCPQDAMPAFTAEDFRRLPLTPPALTIQPNRAEVLVNMATITWTDPTPQLLVTDLLGYTVEVQATPTSYTWDYGDGSPPLVTTSPGHPWPDHDVAHTYARPGTFTITLTTTLTGTYRMAGTTTWLPVTGTATTTTTSPPITAVDAPSRLVAGDCATHPDPDHC